MPRCTGVRSMAGRATTIAFTAFLCVLSWHHIDYAAQSFFSVHASALRNFFLRSFFVLFLGRQQLQSDTLETESVFFTSIRLMTSPWRENIFGLPMSAERQRDGRDGKYTLTRSVSTNLINDVLNTFNYHLNAHRRVRDNRNVPFYAPLSSITDLGHPLCSLARKKIQEQMVNNCSNK